MIMRHGIYGEDLESGFMRHSTGCSDVYELSITYITKQGARFYPRLRLHLHITSAHSAVVHASTLTQFTPSRRRCRWGFGDIRGWQCTGVSDPSRLDDGST
jgi:hypothetical protein